MEDKESYTPQEVAAIAKNYLGFCRGGQYKDIEAFANDIPPNVRQGLGIDSRLGLLKAVEDAAISEVVEHSRASSL